MNQSSKHRFQLDRGSKKFNCPGCNKKTLVRYIDDNTGHRLDSHFGRCDRQDNCKYHKKPTDDDYFMDQIRNEEREYKKLINGNHKNGKETASNSVQKTYYDVTIPKDEIQKSREISLSENSLFNFLLKSVKMKLPQDVIQDAFDRFQVGTSKFVFKNKIGNKYPSGTVVYWWSNSKSTCKGCQIELVHETTGGAIDKLKRPGWMAYSSKEWAKKMKNADSQFPILFGMHQLKNSPHDKPVAICEGAKAAIICSIYFPQFTWMATYNKSSLNLERIEPLRDRRIILFPDAGALRDWRIKARNFRKEDGFSIFVSGFIEKLYKQTGNQLDLDDILMQTEFRSQVRTEIESEFTLF